MNLAWIAAALSLIAAIIAVTAWQQARRRPSDLGYVSHQWIAEHRMSSQQDGFR